MSKKSRHRWQERQTERLPEWTPFERGQPVIRQGYTEEQAIASLLRVEPDLTRDDAVAIMEASRAGQLWVNSRYTVIVQRTEATAHLSIRRNDRKRPGEEKWRDFQRIKNELLGPNVEAVELYPSEERLVDTADQYHLWAITVEGLRFPFGFNKRLVDYVQDGAHTQTAKGD